MRREKQIPYPQNARGIRMMRAARRIDGACRPPDYGTILAAQPPPGASLIFSFVDLLISRFVLW
jgi:hypothetical protein